MDDIVPGLLERVQNDFKYGLENSTEIKKLLKKIRDGTATYADGNIYAIEVGKELSHAYKLNLYSEVLPDGKMYYNIANRIITPTMAADYTDVADKLKLIQEALNTEAGLQWKAIVPKLNKDRIDGIINRITSEDVFDNVAWILDEPVINYSQSIVDDFVKSNADFLNKSGLPAQVIRTFVPGCCEWCEEVAGIYNYPDVPKDVYRRHERCRCTVEYTPSAGIKKDVWKK